jgi:glycosyltransferase involved in cell wall biosynthesis
VVLVAYNIPREASRTLYSLCADYQQYIDPSDYEIIVVDNGSDVPIDAGMIENLAGNFRLIRIDDAQPSPARAINLGIAQAQGKIVGVMIDGARIATPGLLHFALHGARLHHRAVVATLGWYLGYDFQGRSENPESERDREDALLDSIEWPNDGYRLFEIGTMDESSIDGWLQPITESNALFLSRELWALLGGVSEQFDAPGGGLLNLDTFSRVLELPDTELVILLGEATFHQWHGGINTNVPSERQLDNWKRWEAQYVAVRGRPFAATKQERPPTYIGTLSPPALARFVRAALHPASRDFKQPLGPNFNRDLWTGRPPAHSSDETIERLLELARIEFAHGRFEASCAVARLIHARAPGEAGIRDILPLVAHSVSNSGPHESHRPDYHLALAEAYRILGDGESSASQFRAALTFNRNLTQAHLGLAALRMPGDGYLAVLDKLYRALAPETAVEIGVYEGASLALFRPPTIAIGVDPSAKLLVALQTETHVFAETSDEFFARHRYETLLGGRTLSVGFIDGLHLFEQALKDFIGLEALCGPRSVLVMHDTVPLDEPTQRRTCDTGFHTGDVWKVVLCLKLYRPDLDIFTIGTPPTGLTVVTGLDPASRVLPERYEEAIARFMEMPFSAIASVVGTALNIVDNDWDFVQSRLKERGIIE